MPEGLRLANEDIRLANEGLRVAVLLKHAAESSTLARLFRPNHGMCLQR